jgi:hypothetical protein
MDFAQFFPWRVESGTPNRSIIPRPIHSDVEPPDHSEVALTNPPASYYARKVKESDESRQPTVYCSSIAPPGVISSVLHD